MFRASSWLAARACELASSPAAAQGQVNILRSVPIPWCEAIVAQLQKDAGIKVGMSQKAAGEAMAQLAAEKASPKHDVWYAGSGDAHLQAAEQGLTEECRSPLLPQLHDWAVKQAEQAKFRTVGLFVGALGFGYNSDLLAKKKLPVPKCWADLARTECKDELQIANPNASGTAYLTIATLVHIFGEDKAFDLLRGMHRSTNSYPRTGAGAIRAVGRGETTLGVTFLDDGVIDIAAGFPAQLVAPCAGTGYQVRSMSLVKGGEERRRGEAVLRLGADARRAEARRRHQELPDDVQSGDAGPRRRHPDVGHHVHRLRLQQVRRCHRAQTSAREVGPRGLRAAARLIGRAGRPNWSARLRRRTDPGT